MRVLIADDHDLLRDSFCMYLEGTGDIQADGVENLDMALARLDEGARYDVVLLDLNMPGMNGLDGLRRVLDHGACARVALVSGLATRSIAEEALRLGAAGFLPKTLPAQSVVNAVRFMAMGEVYAPLDFMTAEAEAPAHPLAEKLTERERQVLQGLTEGKSNKEIARDLHLTEPTIKLHMKTLYRKLGANNRTQAALTAREAGLF